MAEMAHIFQEERREESPIHAQNEAAENNNAIDFHDEVASGNGNSHDTVMVIDRSREMEVPTIANKCLWYVKCLLKC